MASLREHMAHSGAIEAVRKGFPRRGAVRALALIVEIVDPVGQGTLMVPAMQRKSFIDSTVHVRK